ncbi:MAG TPA: GH32 C-terminal domain-containing protein [Candidatus Brocadiia bacterium]|nr:GH32 C-terminal domain-containing protein [Candidatus Brocadiia bacterium]
MKNALCVIGSCLVLISGGRLIAADGGQTGEMKTITDKTLVAWVALADLKQSGGSALTIEDGADHFDAIVFGEIARGKWMAGSDGFNRTPQNQGAWPLETADPQTLVQMAVVYRGKTVSIFRNGQVYASYEIAAPQSFGPASFAVMGLRHVASGPGECLAGGIADARIYDVPLSLEQIAALKPNEPSDPAPLAWWSFGDGRVSERMGVFPNTKLFGEIEVSGGRLRIPGKGSYLVSARGEPQRWRGAGATAPHGDLIADARAMRAKLLSDQQRPRYHFVSPEGVCHPFDPNGAIFWKGKYHLMYIIQDPGHCWGHATSADLLHWRILPPALVPGNGDDGIFSGGAFVNKEGKPTIIYHGCGAGNCIAISRDDELIEWEKPASNPIVPMPKQGDPDYGKYSSWDPHGWLEGDTYYAIFGGETPTLFRSSDLKKWEHRGPFITDRKWIVGRDASCPDFFKLGDKHVFVFISHDRGAQYAVGTWKDEKFTPERHGLMNWPGGRYFAPETLVDDKGRRILWAWVCEARPHKCWLEAGWSGVMSLPRVLSLAPDGSLLVEPIAEVERLRLNPRKCGNLNLAADREIPLEGIAGDSIELALEIEPGKAKQVGLSVRRSPGGEEETVIAYDPAEQALILDVTKSSLSPDVRYGWPDPHSTAGKEDIRAQKAPLSLKAGEPLRLRVFVDCSIVEVFANGRQCVTQRIYPTRPDAVGVSLFAKGGAAKIVSADAWDMAPTNPW